MANKKKIVGWKSLLLATIIFIPMNYIAYKANKNQVLLPITIMYFVFTAVYRISNTGITILTLNPFRWRRKIAFEEIEHAIISCERIFIMTLYLKTGKKINSTTQLITDEAFEIYTALSNENILIKSEGTRTYNWPS